MQSLDAVPGNLPKVSTELLGRSDDLARLALVLERERLVTLIGVGRSSLPTNATRGRQEDQDLKPFVTAPRE